MLRSLALHRLLHTASRRHCTTALHCLHCSRQREARTAAFTLAQTSDPKPIAASQGVLASLALVSTRPRLSPKAPKALQPEHGCNLPPRKHTRKDVRRSPLARRSLPKVQGVSVPRCHSLQSQMRILGISITISSDWSPMGARAWAAAGGCRRVPRSSALLRAPPRSSALLRSTRLLRQQRLTPGTACRRCGRGRRRRVVVAVVRGVADVDEVMAREHADHLIANVGHHHCAASH